MIKSLLITYNPQGNCSVLTEAVILHVQVHPQEVGVMRRIMAHQLSFKNKTWIVLKLIAISKIQYSYKFWGGGGFITFYKLCCGPATLEQLYLFCKTRTNVYKVKLNTEQQFSWKYISFAVLIVEAIKHAPIINPATQLVIFLNLHF